MKPMNEQQHRRMRHNVRLAMAAVVKLVDKGFTVTGITLTDLRKPRISIANRAGGGILAGVVYRYGLDSEGAYETYAANYCGCQVEWTRRRGVRR